MKKSQIIVLIILLLYGMFLGYDEYNKRIEFQEVKKELLLRKIQKEVLSTAIDVRSFTGTIKSLDAKNINLNVQFYPQSPFGKWGAIFNDTCEEASVLIAINYIRNISMTREEFRDGLLGMVDWQNIEFGDYKHTSVDETAEILDRYFNFSNFQIINDPSISIIKRYLKEGNIIIAPFYGVGLNPNYSGIGPEYHFMVIKGYSNDMFITHDVGTKTGENYFYEQSELMERLHDYNLNGIEYGDKKLIVLKIN